MAVRAKFKVHNVESVGMDDGGTVTMYPVVSGSDENKSFYKYTPAGLLQLSTINQAALDQFEVGKEYYIDISPAS